MPICLFTPPCNVLFPGPKNFNLSAHWPGPHRLSRDIRGICTVAHVWPTHCIWCLVLNNQRNGHAIFVIRLRQRDNILKPLQRIVKEEFRHNARR